MEFEVTRPNDLRNPVEDTTATRAPRQFDGDDPSWAIAATQPNLSTDRRRTDPHATPVQILPLEPQSFADAGLRESQVEALILKFLLNCGTASGREIAEQIALPFGIMEKMLLRLKAEQLLVHRNDAPVADYNYELTPAGSERARRHAAQSTYFGSAPVQLEDYIRSVEAQSVRRQRPTLDTVQAALADLVLSDQMLNQLGEGVNSGMGFFLYGEPGNGKTSIAERITAAYSECIWIPRAIMAAGEIIRMFDPNNHVLCPPDNHEGYLDDRRIDKRWVRIQRPTIVVGGELKLESLEVSTSEVTGISEAPLQMKANCGTLVIDDFGRQRFRPAELLNRLIVPLERRTDFLNLPSGRTFQIPFDQLVVFSTNLDPMSLVDEAFLRRIPYKVDVTDPTEKQYRDVFTQEAKRCQLTFEAEVLDYLMQRHYGEAGRKMRFCHPRDLLHQVLNACKFRNEKLEVTREKLDNAVRNHLMLQAKSATR